MDNIKKINQHIYYMEHKDQYLKSNKKWREKNKEKVKRYAQKENKKYYQEHREELLLKAKERREKLKGNKL